MRRSALLALLLLFAACTQIPVTDEITIEPAPDGDTMTVTVSSTFNLNVKSDANRARVDAARAAALSGVDPWSVRFGRLDAPIDERHTIEKHRGAVERVTRAARIPSDDLQQLLSDTGITVDTVRGEGWRELRFYPGAGGRATREQQAELERTLEVWSRSVTRYFTAMHHFYRYMDENPHRAQAMFAALLDEKQADGTPATVLAEEEQPLLDAVTHSMDEIATRMDQEEGRTAVFELTDLVFNPFPGRVVIRAPGDVVVSEGFTRKGSEATIEPVDLFASLEKLEGRWIAPDPLAAMLREQELTSEQLARAERRSAAVVSASEVSRAIREQLVRPRTYVVRWRD
ncbi:MAG TPA: hypothetical protein VND45_15630 [Thermoanaerobaculia bacterium]|nr:hypothetical protein [Thermoanaerobaculia bacterium]